MQTASRTPFVFVISSVRLKEGMNEGKDNWACDRRRRTKTTESTNKNITYFYSHNKNLYNKFKFLKN